MINEQKKILIVEDDNALLKILSDTLRKENLIIFEARDGAQGYRAALDSKPDLILLDVLMPIMDGITMLKKIRQQKEGKDIPVIVLTNLEALNTLNEALGAGAYDYIVKSDWKLEDIVKKIKERLMNG
jgi:DNA-binding response OmpR family regulator